MRALIFDLRPHALTDEGLLSALTMQARALSARSGRPVTVRGCDRHLLLDPDAEARLYRQAVHAMRDAVDAAGTSPTTAVETAIDIHGDTVCVTVTSHADEEASVSFSASIDPYSGTPPPR